MILLVVLTWSTVWVLGAIALAFLTGAMIHEREERDRPFGGGRSIERAAAPGRVSG